MIKKKKIACVIPARLHSTRFPGKVLQNLAGEPLLKRVYKAAKKCRLFDSIIIAVDDQLTYDLVSSFTKNVIYTSPTWNSGTDRLIEVYQNGSIAADIWVNWQADEPFLSKEMLLELLSSIDTERDIWTLKKKITNLDEVKNTNITKVVTDNTGRAMYFSRHSIPYDSGKLPIIYFKHIGIYAFTQKALETISRTGPVPLEINEQLEQLRFLYHGLHIQVHETKRDSIGIDTPQDLSLAEQFWEEQYSLSKKVTSK